MSGASPQLESAHHNKSATEVAGPLGARNDDIVVDMVLEEVVLDTIVDLVVDIVMHRDEVNDDGLANGPIDHAKGGGYYLRNAPSERNADDSVGDAPENFFCSPRDCWPGR